MYLEIKYENWNGSSNGVMIVCLDKFLNCRNIGKFRKLIKLIDRSFSPDDIDRVEVFIEHEVERFEPLQKEDANNIVRYTEKVKFYERQLENVLYNRNKFKKNSDGWTHYDKYVKPFRQELKAVRPLLNSSKGRFNERVKDKKFYEKCLGIISQGR